MLLDRFKRVYVPDQKVAIDESLVKFRVRLSGKTLGTLSSQNSIHRKKGQTFKKVQGLRRSWNSQRIGLHVENRFIVFHTEKTMPEPLEAC
jgi:hypothetical protein